MRSVGFKSRDVLMVMIHFKKIYRVVDGIFDTERTYHFNKYYLKVTL